MEFLLSYECHLDVVCPFASVVPVPTDGSRSKITLTNSANSVPQMDAFRASFRIRCTDAMGEERS